MKIGINVSWMTPGQAGGMEGYARNLIDQLGVLDQENEYVLVTAPNNYKTFKLPSSRWKMIVYTGSDSSPLAYKVSWNTSRSAHQRVSKLRQLYRQLKQLYKTPRLTLKQLYYQLSLLRTSFWAGQLSTFIEQEGIQLWFCPFIYALPIDINVPVIVTIPDLQHKHYPEFFDEQELVLRTLGYQYSCKASVATIGISNHVANEIVNLYDIDPAKVFGIPLALDNSFQISQAEVERLVARARLKFRIEQGCEFVLYPANGWPHKNHETLVKAIDIVQRRGYKIKLILTGAQFDVMDRLRPLIERCNLSEVVYHLGYVDKHDLIGLYGASSMLIFPSHFEGFGLPLLEAMYLGVPVACSDVGSLPEVGGEAALYFNPDDPETIAEAIIEVTQDEARRQQLIVAGQKQVQNFNYKRTAQQTLELFNKVRDNLLVSAKLSHFRPNIAHNWLNEGHSRWFFHFPSLKEIEIKVVQPTNLPELINQTITISLNGYKILESQLEPQREYQFNLPVIDNRCDNFYQLDISASDIVSISGQVLSLQVCGLAIVDSNNNRLNLIK